MYPPPGYVTLFLNIQSIKKDECIREGILAEFLSQNRAEAMKVSIYEYDEEKHMRQEREQHFAEGLEQGRLEGESRIVLLTQALLKAGRISDLQKAAEDEAYREQLCKELKIN